LILPEKIVARKHVIASRINAENPLENFQVPKNIQGSLV